MACILPPNLPPIKSSSRMMKSVRAEHVGKHLAEELKELQFSASQLARQIKVPTNRITQVLNGKPAITGDTALRLAHFFGTSAQFWLNLQNLYELRMLRREQENPLALCPQ